MSISSSNMYKIGKTREQLEEDKAVQLHFRKMLQAAKNMKKTYKKEDLRELREIERYDDSIASSGVDPISELGRLINRMDEQHRALSKIKAAKVYDATLDKQERVAERALKAEEDYVMEFIGKHSLNPAKVKELMKRHRHSQSVSVPTGPQRRLKEKDLITEESRTMDQLYKLALRAKM